MGTVLELPLSRRVQLAVVAHIRHVYTDYDKLLKTGTYQKARATVEKPCLDLLARWRSDDDDDPNAMEEILREVIVIDDDDDEVNDRKSSLGNRDSINRESSIEIISSHALPDEVQVHQIDYGGPAQLIHGGQPYSPDFMDSEIVRHSDLEQLPNFHHTRSNLSSLDRNGVHRHRWREALDRHRTNLVPIHPGKHELLAQKSAVYPRVSMYHTEAESRQLRVVDQSRELLPPDTVKPQFPGHLGPKGKENIPQRRSDFADRRLRPEPPRLREVSTLYLINFGPKFPVPAHRFMKLQAVVGFTKSQQVILPTEVYLQNSRESLTEPMSFQRIRTIDNDHNHGYLGQPRINTSEERITRVRDKISERDVIDSTHNYQPRHVIHQTPGQILRSVESNTLQTNDGKDPFNIPHNRSSNYLDESFRFDRGVDFEPRGIHVNDETEAYHSKRRRVEELAPIASDVLRQHDSRSHSDRNVLVPLGRGNNWAESHEQLSPVAPSSVMNPFIRQNSNVYDQPVQATRYVDRETIPRAVPYKASSPSRGPMRAFDSDETLHPSSHSLRNLPIGSRQPGHDFLYPTFEALGKASLVPSFRDEHIRLQSSHEPFTLSNSSRDAYVHPPRNLPNRRFIDPIEYRPAGRQQYEQDLRSDFARLDTGSRYVSENSKPSNDGLETHRGTLLTAYRDRSPEIRGEAPTCIFLRKLPDENYALPQKAKSSSSTTRLIYHANSSPRGDFDEFLPTGAGSRVLQARTPVQENIQVNSWQDNSRLANDQRCVLFFYKALSVLSDCELTNSAGLTIPGLKRYPVVKMWRMYLRRMESSVGLLIVPVRDTSMSIDGNEQSLARLL